MAQRERRLGQRRARQERRAKIQLTSTSTEKWLTPRIAAWLEVALVCIGFLLSALILTYLGA